MTQNVSETLNRAAVLIEERGWRKGAGGWPGVGSDESGKSLCLEGGIMAALGGTYSSLPMREFWACPAYVAVRDHLGLSDAMEPNVWGTTKVPADPMWRYNDARGRTASEVIEVLRATAVIEAARETEAAMAVTR